jgi:hypothetical protein
VLGQAEGVYRLVELATGRELARLDGPEHTPGAAVFTPDGRCLVVTARDGLRVWNLRRIRAELIKVDLDWEVPCPPEKEAGVREPLQVQVIRGAFQ